MSVLFWFTDPDYTFGIFKLFLLKYTMIYTVSTLAIYSWMSMFIHALCTPVYMSMKSLLIFWIVLSYDVCSDWNMTEKYLPTVPEHLCLPQFCYVICAAQCLFLFVVLCRTLFVVLSVLLITPSGYPFGIVKHFLRTIW